MIVAGSILLAVLPTMLLSVFLVLRNPEMRDTYFISYHFGVGGLIRTAVWLSMGLGLLIWGIRTVIKAP